MYMNATTKAPLYNGEIRYKMISVAAANEISVTVWGRIKDIGNGEKPVVNNRKGAKTWRFEHGFFSWKGRKTKKTNKSDSFGTHDVKSHYIAGLYYKIYEWVTWSAFIASKKGEKSDLKAQRNTRRVGKII